MHVERALLLRLRSFQWPQSTSYVLFIPHSFPKGLSLTPLFLLSHSPLLPLPVHPPSGTHWPVSQVLVLPSSEFRVSEFPLTLTRIYRLIGLSVTTPTDCQALFVFIQWAGNTAIGASTSLLLIRTVAVWNRSPYIIAPMLLLAAGQWGLLYYSELNTSVLSTSHFPLSTHTSPVK